MSADDSEEPEFAAAPVEARPDAFICYAREDAEVVATLRDGLLQRGKSVWVDRKDIPFSAPWRERARDGIDASKAVVFVLSVHWVESAPCAFEFEHARSASKRLIPVMVGPEAVTARLPSELAALAWIPLVEIGLDAAVAVLADTLEADLEWREAHSRLLVRAVEWDGEGRRVSALLRGTELRTAEGWLDEPSQHGERPTRLQTEYILASRRAAGRRQRLLLAAVGLALVVSLTLGALAYWQRGVALDRQRDAVLQRDAAVRNSREARSRELAAIAAARRATDIDLALLLAFAGFRLARTAEARSAIVSALAAASPLRATARGHGAPMVSSVAFAPDGRSIASTGDDGTVRLWDPKRGAQTGARLHLGGRGLAVAFDPTDPHTLASASTGGVVRLWRLDGRRASSVALERRRGATRDLAFTPDGRRLAMAGADGRIRVWDLTTRRRRAGIRAHSGEVAAVAFNPDGRTLVSAGAEDGALRLWDGARGAPRGPRLPSAIRSPQDAAFDPSGRILAAAGAGGAVELWDWRRRDLLAALRIGREPVLSIAFVGNRALAVAGGDRRIRFIAAPWRRPSTTALVAHTGPVESLALSPGRSDLASAAADGTIRIWSIPPRPPLALSVIAQAPTAAVSVSPAGDRVVGVGRTGSVQTIDLARSRRRSGHLPSARHPIRDLTISGDGSRAALIDGSGRMLSWTADEEPAPMRHPSGEVVALSRHGEQLASAGLDGTVRLWSTRPQRNLGIIFRSSAPTSSLTFDPRRNTVAAGGYDGAVRLLDMPGVRTLGEGESRVTALAFDRSARVLAAGTANGAVLLFDVRRGRRLGTGFVAHNTGVAALALSDDLRTLASAGEHGDLRLWDVQRRRQVGEPLTRLAGPAPALAFDRSGALVAGGTDGRVVRWDPLMASFDLEAWRTRVCRLVGRGLNRREWEQYVPGEAFEPICRPRRR